MHGGTGRFRRKRIARSWDAAHNEDSNPMRANVLSLTPPFAMCRSQGIKACDSCVILLSSCLHQETSLNTPAPTLRKLRPSKQQRNMSGPEPDPQTCQWMYDTIPQYRLNVNIIHDYLSTLWPGYTFFIDVSRRSTYRVLGLAAWAECMKLTGNVWRFWVPRQLKQVSLADSHSGRMPSAKKGRRRRTRCLRDALRDLSEAVAILIDLTPCS